MSGFNYMNYMLDFRVILSRVTQSMTAWQRKKNRAKLFKVME